MADVVYVFNARGACYAGAALDDRIRLGEISISTGAWFEPESSDRLTSCKHGDRNIPTFDRAASGPVQGTIAHSRLLDLKRADDPPVIIMPEATQGDR